MLISPKTVDPMELSLLLAVVVAALALLTGLTCGCSAALLKRNDQVARGLERLLLILVLAACFLGSSLLMKYGIAIP